MCCSLFNSDNVDSKSDACPWVTVFTLSLETHDFWFCHTEVWSLVPDNRETNKDNWSCTGVLLKYLPSLLGVQERLRCRHSAISNFELDINKLTKLPWVNSETLAAYLCDSCLTVFEKMSNVVRFGVGCQPRATKYSTDHKSDLIPLPGGTDPYLKSDCT